MARFGKRRKLVIRFLLFANRHNHLRGKTGTAKRVGVPLLQEVVDAFLLDHIDEAAAGMATGRGSYIYYSK